MNCPDEESLMNAVKATLSFNFTSKLDGNFTSDRVLFPEVNNFPSISWKIVKGGKVSEPRPKVLGQNCLTKQQQNTQEINKSGTDMQEQIPPLSYLKLIIDDLFTPICDENKKVINEIEDFEIEASKNSLVHIMYEIIPQYEEILRLARLEESGRQFLIDEQEYMMKELFDVFRSL